MHALSQEDVKEVWIACGTKFGKALYSLTNLPTPEGSKLMRDVQVGDRVLDENGMPTKVVGISPIYLDHKCYEVALSDGQKFIADAEHLWEVKTDAVQILTTEEMAGTEETMFIRGYWGGWYVVHVVSVTEVPTVPVKCIKVENPSGLFLIGKGLVTHNSLSCSASLVNAAVPTRNTMWRWVAPIYLQTLIGMKYVSNLLPGRPYTQPSESGICPQIKLLPNNSTFQFFHGQKPETLEGEGVHGYVLDEAAKMKEDVYDSAYTTTTMTKGRFLVCSTPLGKNWFYRKCMNAKDEMMEALKKGEVPRKLFITAPTHANPFVEERTILEAKRNLPDHLFRQYFLAEFVDQSSVFHGFRDCIYGHPVGAGKKMQVHLPPKAKEMDVVLGVDWAKSNDFTVFTAWAPAHGSVKARLVGLLRFQDDYMASVKQLVWFAKQFRTVQLVRHDKTGIGNVLDEILMQTNLNFEGVVFTNESKAHMINTLMLAIQTRRVEFLHWPDMIDEMDAFEVSFTEIGKAVFSAPNGGHDDIVASMILGYSGVEEFAGIERSIIGLEESVVDVSRDGRIILPEPKTVSWFGDMLKDEDDDFKLFID